MRIELPWPPSELSPNARLHWRAKAPITSAYRTLCEYEAKSQLKGLPQWPYLGVMATFHPPHKRGDDDNAVGAFKAGRDGVADAIGIDDRKWRVTYQWGEVVKNGCVVLDFYSHDGKVVPYTGSKFEVKI